MTYVCYHILRIAWAVLFVCHFPFSVSCLDLFILRSEPTSMRLFTELFRDGTCVSGVNTFVLVVMAVL